MPESMTTTENRPKLPLKLPEPAIQNENIWAGDLFNRSQYAATLRGILAETSEPMVVAVNGKWGCGKTFFLRRFAEEYKKGSHPSGICIYLNAWESDYLSDPLLFLFAGISNALKQEEKQRWFDSGALKACGKAAGQIAFNAANHCCRGWLSGVLEIFSKRPLAVYAQRTELTNQLKKSLSSLVEAIKKHTKKPLIICVDELDRCRPTYAIEVLERIKHFFNIPGIVFMIGIDRKQLCESIVSVYGNIDKENYLHRFFDFEFVLPPPNRASFINEQFANYGLEQYWSSLDSRTDKNLNLPEGRQCKQALQLLADVHQLELRELQTALKCLAILARSQKEGYYSYAVVAIVLIVLRLRDRELYDKYSEGKTTPKAVLDFLFPTDNESMLEQCDKAILAGIIATVYSSFPRRHGENPFVAELERLLFSQGTLQSLLSNENTWMFKAFGNDFLNLVINKINQYQKFYSDDYDDKVLKAVVARLETLSWCDV